MKYNLTPRNIAIAILLILTLVLGIVSIIIAVRLGQTDIPVAETSCPGGYASGISQGVCGGSFCGSGYTSDFVDANGDGIGCCKCNLVSTTTGGTTGGTTTGGTTGSGGVGQGGACNPAANECQSGLVCTPSSVNGPNVCNVPPTGSACTGENTCSVFLGFHCDQLTNGECNANGQNFSSFSEAASHAGGCGQVDQVCTGGSPGNHQLCGSFQVFNTSCFVNPPPPPPENPPPPPPENPPPPPTENPPPPPVSSPTLPETAVISEDFDRLMLGFMMIILGLLAYRFNLFGKLFTNVDAITSNDSAIKHSPLNRLLKSTRSSFERKVEKDFENEK